MSTMKACIGLAGVLALGACAVAPPAGPSVLVMPGKGKTFEAFQNDDVTCRSAATQSIGGAHPGQAAAASTVGSAAVGTGLGAAAGALAGSTVGAMGVGAAVGAGLGLLMGTAAGAGAGEQSYYADAAGVRHDLRPVHGIEGRPGAAGERRAVSPGLSGAGLLLCAVSGILLPTLSRVLLSRVSLRILLRAPLRYNAASLAAARTL